MLTDKAVLIVEDNIFLAIDLSHEIEHSGGRVVGPASTAEEALRLMASEEVEVAVIDCDVAEHRLTELVMHLAEKEVPVVIHTAAGLPADIGRIVPEAPVLREPIRSKEVVALLVTEVAKKNRR